MHDRLRQFNGDVDTKEALLGFIMSFINEEALKKMYDKQDVSHIGDAVSLINGAFESLETTYGIQIKQNTPTNQAK